MTAGIEAYLNYLRAKGYTAGTIRWQKCDLQAFQIYLIQREIQSFSLVTTEIMQILAVPDLRTPVGIRDRAILELFYSSGLRLQELINLNLSDIDWGNGYLQVIQGKNHKDRMVPIGDTALKFVEAYLKLVRWWFLHDPAETALFIDSAKGNRLSPQTIKHIVAKTIRKTGITKKVTPHTLRHAMATHLLQNQADIRHIQMMLGHASVATTEIYTHLAIDDLKAVCRRAHPHGRRRDSNSASD
jgi:integrase/recombinase XerD